jgi:hypothetical protein
VPKGPLVHLHIPKVGGTTCHQYFQSQYSKPAIFLTDGKREHGSQFSPITVDCSYSADFVQQIQQGNHDLIVGHLPFGIHKKVGKARGDVMLYFCILRHPVHRVWSLYHMQRRNKIYKLFPYLHRNNNDFKKTLIETPPKELLECHNDQIRMVLGSGELSFNQEDLNTAIDLLENTYFYVTILEQFESRKPEIKELFKFGGKDWPNTNIGRQAGGYTEDPDPELWKIIEERNKWDLARYEYVKNRGGLVGKAIEELKQEEKNISD